MYPDGTHRPRRAPRRHRRLGLRARRCERLLDVDVLALCERERRRLSVEVGGKCDDDRVELREGEAPLLTVRERACEGCQCAGLGQPFGVGIGDGDELACPEAREDGHGQPSSRSFRSRSRRHAHPRLPHVGVHAVRPTIRLIAVRAVRAVARNASRVMREIAAAGAIRTARLVVSTAPG